MSLKDTLKDLGGGDFAFLSSDGEVIQFVMIDEAVVLTSKFKGKEQTRIGLPVVTDEGFVLFVTGTRVARKLSKFESSFKTSAFMVVRHGGENDVNTKYDVSVVSDATKTKQLFNIAKEYKPAMLKEALEAVKQVVEN